MTILGSSIIEWIRMMVVVISWSSSTSYGNNQLKCRWSYLHHKNTMKPMEPHQALSKNMVDHRTYELRNSQTRWRVMRQRIDRHNRSRMTSITTHTRNTSEWQLDTSPRISHRNRCNTWKNRTKLYVDQVMLKVVTNSWLKRTTGSAIKSLKSSVFDFSIISGCFLVINQPQCAKKNPRLVLCGSPSVSDHLWWTRWSRAHT